MDGWMDVWMDGWVHPLGGWIRWMDGSGALEFCPKTSPVLSGGRKSAQQTPGVGEVPESIGTPSGRPNAKKQEDTGRDKIVLVSPAGGCLDVRVRSAVGSS